jgi:hypothetical protein
VQEFFVSRIPEFEKIHRVVKTSHFATSKSEQWSQAAYYEWLTSIFPLGPNSIEKIYVGLKAPLILPVTLIFGSVKFAAHPKKRGINLCSSMFLDRHWIMKSWTSSRSM